MSTHADPEFPAVVLRALVPCISEPQRTGPGTYDIQGAIHGLVNFKAGATRGECWVYLAFEYSSPVTGDAHRWSLMLQDATEAVIAGAGDAIPRERSSAVAARLRFPLPAMESAQYVLSVHVDDEPAAFVPIRLQRASSEPGPVVLH